MGNGAMRPAPLPDGFLFQFTGYAAPSMALELERLQVSLEVVASVVFLQS